MNTGILHIAINATEQKTDDGVFQAGGFQLASSGASLDDAPTVNLSRHGDKCPTPIDNLQEHNHHMPGFQNEDEMKAYIARVQKDVSEAIAGYSGNYTETPAPQQNGDTSFSAN
tara:strand:- start:112 stop:453 length:342 start_codon:yes stop_codon:yes gene_type:complete